MVRDVFWEEDVLHILAIPVHVGREDVIAWHFDKKGFFSVKSTYHTLHDSSVQKAKKQKGESSSGQMCVSIWNGWRFGAWTVHQKSNSFSGACHTIASHYK